MLLDDVLKKPVVPWLGHGIHLEKRWCLKKASSSRGLATGSTWKSAQDLKQWDTIKPQALFTVDPAVKQRD